MNFMVTRVEIEEGLLFIAAGFCIVGFLDYFYELFHRVAPFDYAYFLYTFSLFFVGIALFVIAERWHYILEKQDKRYEEG